MPSAIILAGPNGAGKSTAKPLLIRDEVPFLNADEIARDLREQGIAQGADLAAGRLLIQRYDEMVQDGLDFATETNLANRSLAQRIPRWQNAGYRVALLYLWVPSPEFAINRVRQRVLTGGHDVPEETVRRRYYLGIANFFSVYVPLVDRWRLLDSSGLGGPRLIERGIRQVRDRDLWKMIRSIRDNTASEETNK